MLTILGTGFDDIDPAVGDLDISSQTLTILGAGANSTTIDASAINHRIFHIPFDIFFVGSVSIEGVKLTGGDTTGIGASGGAINLGSRNASQLVLDDVVITGNTAGAFGVGGVRSVGNLTIMNSTISNNTGTGVSQGADGNNPRTLTISDSTFSGNTGSGVRIDRGTLTVTNSTFSGNGSGGGFLGGVSILGGGTAATLTNVTIANNRYGILGQDSLGDPGITVRNCIIAGSTVRDIFNDVDADFAVLPGSGGNNIVGDNSGLAVFNQTGDQNNTDPLLDPLELNAPGTTQTHAIPCTSPAFDAANTTAAPTTDQRGVVRPQGAAADIGAFELDAADDDGDGVPNSCDVCPDFNDADDADSDGVPDGCDTCTDADGDNYGNGDNGNTGCDGGTADDCDDTDSAINPGANEICNGVDDNCDGDTDEGFVSDESCFLQGPCAADNVGSRDPRKNNLFIWHGCHSERSEESRGNCRGDPSLRSG